jgi:hypothetical protein
VPGGSRGLLPPVGTYFFAAGLRAGDLRVDFLRVVRDLDAAAFAGLRVVLRAVLRAVFRAVFFAAGRFADDFFAGRFAVDFRAVDFLAARFRVDFFATAILPASCLP